MGSSGAAVSSPRGTLRRRRQLFSPIWPRPAPPPRLLLLGWRRLAVADLPCTPVALLPRDPPSPLSALPADPASAGASFPASVSPAAAPLRSVSPLRAGPPSPVGPSGAAVSSPRRSGVGRRLLPGFRSRGCGTSPLHFPLSRRPPLSREMLRCPCQLSPRGSPAPPSALPADPGLAAASSLASASPAAAPLRSISPVPADPPFPVGPSVAPVSSPRRSGLGRRVLPSLGSRGCDDSPLHFSHACRCPLGL